MEQNEILEGNKLIAEFMGLKMEKIPIEFEHYNLIQWVDLNGAVVYAGGDSWSLTDAQGNDYTIPYHLSWDWLMPVVETIENTCLGEIGIRGQRRSGHKYTSIVNLYFLGKNKPKNDMYFRSENYSKIHCVWTMVIKWIEWYNLTQTKGE